MANTGDEQHSSWNFSSGLPDGGKGKITSSVFDYNDDGDKVQLKVLIDFADDDVNGGDPFEARYGVGGDDEWEVIEKGKRVRPRKREGKTFNRNSGVAALATTAMLAGHDLPSRGDGTAYDASLWTGIDGDFRRYEFSSSNRDGSTIEWSWLLFDVGDLEDSMPIKQIGGESSDEKPKGRGATGRATPASASKAKASKAEAPAAAPAEAGNGSTEAGSGDNPWGIPAVLAAQLKALAKQHETHPAFMEAAFDQFGGKISGDDAAELAVALDGDGGIWHAVKG